ERARSIHEPVRGQPRPGGQARQDRRLRRPVGPRKGRSGRRRAPARRPRHAWPGNRPSRLSGPSRGPGDRDRHEWHPVAVARRGHRDGLRCHGRRGAGYDGRGRDPRSAGSRRSRRPPVLPSGALTGSPVSARLRPHRHQRSKRAPGVVPRRDAVRPDGRQGGTARMVPTELRYTKDHEWVRVDGDEATVGITEYAAGQLGDIVFVELPPAGRGLAQFAAFGVVESVKAVSDLFAPLTGEVTAANDALAGSPELVNSDPYGEGWMVRLKLTAPDEVDELLDATAYDALIAAG